MLLLTAYNLYSLLTATTQSMVLLCSNYQPAWPPALPTPPSTPAPTHPYPPTLLPLSPPPGCAQMPAGIALLNGMTGAVDTFVSQAHGSRSYPSIGLTLQRALLVSLLTCLPLLALYACMHPVLLLLGQEPTLAAAAARYTLLYAPKLPLHAVILCCYRTLANQGG